MHGIGYLLYAVGSFDMNTVAIVNTIKPRLFEICQTRGGGQNPPIPCNSAI